MEPKITTLTIDRFRAFRRLNLEGLGRVNLLTGRNNTGKSSVLEALRLLASEASPAVIYDILCHREEAGAEEDETSPPGDAGWFQMSSLFHGFPQVSENGWPITISSDGGQRPMKIGLGINWFSEERDPDGFKRLVPRRDSLFPEEQIVPGLLIVARGVQRNLPLDALRRYPHRLGALRPDVADESRLACEFVSPYGGERTDTLGRLWDSIALTDRQKDVEDALRIINPEITGVSMIGSEGPRGARRAIVRASGIPWPVPLRTFGDGVNRLFGIVLSMVNARDGLLLIDEFENGLHHSVQVDAWRVIFGLARRLNIQVFATSHSWDAIEAFQKVAADDPEEGVLIRLSRRGEDIIPTVLREKDLAIATRDRIEVR